ncbi:MAG: HNH endonuclease [Acidimicrobiales bacterium]|nr:HNH endonuclease [Acidimicrobiales bacterium]
MPYNISKTLINKLPEGERDDSDKVGKFLLDRQAKICGLCDGEMNPAADVLEADHDQPESEGGPNELKNLLLAHQECNRAKRSLTTAEIRPYLRLKRFIRENGGRIRYDGVTSHFDIEPKPSAVAIGDDAVEVEFADGSKTQAPIYVDSAPAREFRYSFVEVPRVALLNDDKVQPRIIRYGHAFSIYNDLLHNPLHEPPSCRLGPEGKDGLRPLLMFDGQHKTVASWMLEKTRVVVKLYLDLDVADANFLVNSIQAKIKKLPLSAFELAAKMSDEWEAKVGEYETAVAQAGEAGTEKGFIAWMPAGPERNRARQAFKAALIQRVVEDQDFRLMKYVAQKDVGGEDFGLTENMVKSKILDKMVYLKELDLPFVDSTDRRVEEVENIVWLFNMVIDSLVEPGGGQLSEQQKETRRRVFKQGSLQYLAELLGAIYRRELITQEEMLAGKPNKEQRDRIEASVANICRHPVWTARFDRDKQMAAVKLALEKNQNIKESFEDVALKLSYAILGEDDVEYSNYWK